MDRLFVYGTLAPGAANYHLIEGAGGTWQAASCLGQVFTQTQGAHIGLPCFVPSNEGDRIDGQLLSSNKLSTYWAMLDQFEGVRYTRRLISVKTEQGLEVQAYVYASVDEAKFA